MARYTSLRNTARARFLMIEGFVGVSQKHSSYGYSDKGCKLDMFRRVNEEKTREV